MDSYVSADGGGKKRGTKPIHSSVRSSGGLVMALAADMGELLMPQDTMGAPVTGRSVGVGGSIGGSGGVYLYGNSSSASSVASAVVETEKRVLHSVKQRWSRALLPPLSSCANGTADHHATSRETEEPVVVEDGAFFFHLLQSQTRADLSSPSSFAKHRKGGVCTVLVPWHKSTGVLRFRIFAENALDAMTYVDGGRVLDDICVWETSVAVRDLVDRSGRIDGQDIFEESGPQKEMTRWWPLVRPRRAYRRIVRRSRGASCDDMVQEQRGDRDLNGVRSCCQENPEGRYLSGSENPVPAGWLPGQRRVQSSSTISALFHPPEP